MRSEAEHYQCLTQSQFLALDGSSRSGWVHPMTLLADIVTVGYVPVQYTEAPLRCMVPVPLSDTPPVFRSREKCLFFHDFET